MRWTVTASVLKLIVLLELVAAGVIDVSVHAVSVHHRVGAWRRAVKQVHIASRIVPIRRHHLAWRRAGRAWLVPIRRRRAVKRIVPT